MGNNWFPRSLDFLILLPLFDILNNEIQNFCLKNKMKHKQEVKRNWTHKNQNTKRVVSGDILSFIEDASHSFIK